MTKIEQTSYLRGLSLFGLSKAVLGVFLLSGVMAAAIAWRVSGRTGVPDFMPIFTRQLAIWLPWVFYYVAINFLVNRICTMQISSVRAITLHVTAALLIAISHLGWYWQVSSHFSPFLDMPRTRFGVYPFFFIFWFLIDLLVYWSITLAPRGDAHQPQQSPAAKYTKQFSVRKGRAQHIVRSVDINWIEAQGYYAGLHTAAGLYLIRKSLRALENELDPERFVRVHR